MEAATQTRLLDNYVAGKWTAATGTDALDVTNPATGETLARVPLSSSADLDAAVAAARAALPAWRDVSVIARGAAPVRAARGPQQPPRGAGALGHDRDGQDDRRRPRRGRAHDRDGRVRLRDPDHHAGPHPRGRLARDRRRDDPPARRRLRRDRALQLPGDGAVLVPPVRDRLRQHVRAEALGAGAADAADRVRGARLARAARGRRQPRQRRARGRGGHPRPPRHRRRLVRRQRAGGAHRLRALGQGRQARPGARRREEPHGRDAGRRDRPDRQGHHGLAPSARPASAAWRAPWS